VAVWLLFSIQNIMWGTLIISIFLGLFSVVVPHLILVVFYIGILFVPNSILPYLADSNVTHGFGDIRLHPAGIIIFIGSLLNIFIKRKLLIDRINRFKELKIVIILLIFFFISIFVQTLLVRGHRGIPQCLENFIFPFTLFLFLLTVNPKKLSKYLKIFILSILFISSYALIEYMFKENFLYHSLYIHSNTSWYLGFTGNLYRTTTSLGHPLTNAVFFLFVIPLTKHISKKTTFYLISSSILILAIFSTGSRSASLICLIAFMLCHMRVRTNFHVDFKNIFIFFVLILFFLILLFYAPFGNTIKMRFQTGTGSSAIRLGSVSHIPHLIKTYFSNGIGMGFSKEISTGLLGIENSDFENPWTMLITDVGFLTTLVYLAIIIIIVYSRMHYLKYRNINKYIFVSLVSLIIVFSSFDSFGTKSMLNFLFWFNAALLYVFEPKQNDLRNKISNRPLWSTRGI